MSRCTHSTANPPGRSDVAALLDTIRVSRSGRPEHHGTHRVTEHTAPERFAPFMVKMHSTPPGETTGMYRVVRARAERAALLGGVA